MRWLWQITLSIFFCCCILLGCGQLDSGEEKIRHTIATGEPIRTIPIWIDHRATWSQKHGIEQAIQEWNTALSPFIKLYVKGDFHMRPDEMAQVDRYNGWAILIIYSNYWMAGDEKQLAFVNHVGGNYIYAIEDRIPEHWWKGVIMHEMGHLFNVSHGSGLMEESFYYHPNICVDAWTLKQVSEQHHLPFQHMRPCQDWW